MIEYDYLIERNEGNRTVEFVPRAYLKRIPNLCIIQGPNSTGKSTVLNLLALGFFGLKASRIEGSLREQMKTYVEAPHQKVSFKFVVSSEQDGYSYCLQKEDPARPEITVTEIRAGKKRVLAPETLHRQVVLIYDIPSNPTQRLKELVSEIKDIQQLYSIKVQELSDHILRVVDQVKGSQDPKRVSVLAKLTKDRDKRLSTMGDEAAAVEERANLLHKYLVATRLQGLRKRRDRHQAQLDELRKKKKTVESRVFKSNAQLQQARARAESALEEIRHQHTALVARLGPLLPRSARPHLEIWERIDFDESAKDFQFPPEALGQLSTFERTLRNQIEGPNANRIREARLYRDLILLLDRFEDSDFELPVGGIRVRNFTDALRKKADELEVIEKQADAIEAICADLSRFESSVHEAEALLEEYKGVMNQYADSYQEYSEEDKSDATVAGLQAENTTLDGQIEAAIAEAGELGFNEDGITRVLTEISESRIVKDELDKSEAELISEVGSLHQRLRDLQREKARLQTAQIVDNHELKRLKNLTPHRFQDRLDDLNALIQACQILGGRLGKDYRLLAQSLIDKSVPETIPVESRDRYYDAVSKFLGRKLSTIRHGDENLDVDRVDLLNGFILTKGGRKIQLSAMGTGQSQSAYLMGLLNRSDSRKIVALFDETAMMDRASLEPVCKKLVELRDEGRLLVGIIVQRAEIGEVIPLGK
jgi:exonuclease SbcC